MNHKARMYKNKGKIFTSITYYWYGLEEEETIRGKWNATQILTSNVHYNYLPLPHPWTIKIALYVISYQPKATRKTHNGGGGMGQIGPSHIKRVKGNTWDIGKEEAPFDGAIFFHKYVQLVKSNKGVDKGGQPIVNKKSTNIDWPTKNNNSFSMFFEPPSFWPTFGGAN